MKENNAFVTGLLNPSPEKTNLYRRASLLQRQADTLREYAAAAVRTFAESGRESCLSAESRFLTAAESKSRQASLLLDQAVKLR